MTPGDLEVTQEQEYQRIRESTTIAPDVDPEERLRAIREREDARGNPDSRCGYD